MILMMCDTKILSEANDEIKSHELPKPKICFCAFGAYPLLSNTNLSFMGGAELQQVIIAKELVNNNYDVSFIVFDHNQKSFEIFDGIKVYKIFPRDYVLDGIKSIYFSFKSIWEALKKADADIYFQQGAGRNTGITAFFCLIKRKKFIHQLASDMDINGLFIKNARFDVRMLFNFGLKRADCIIAQSEYQQKTLKENYNLNSTIIKNPYPIDELDIKKSNPPIILWVGTIKPEFKQPELFLKLACAIPNAGFQMIGGGSTNKQFYEKIKNDAEKIPNLDFVGFIPYPVINKYFSEASILINTSNIEGFSNTFLQAWMAHTPVISLNSDPDEVICKYKLGFHSKTFEKLINDVEYLLENEKLRNEMGLNGKKYVEMEHEKKTIIKKYMKIFEELSS
jgi:glycosyltransferase involved in cell wall biosynthesis